MDNALNYQVLRDIAKTLTSTYNLDKILNRIMGYIGKLFRCENWSLLMVDQEKGDLYFAIAVGKASNMIINQRINIGDGIIGWVVQHGESLIIRDPYKDNRFATDMDKASGFKTESIICIPLISKEKTLGAIELVNVDDEFFEHTHIEMLESIAVFAAIAIENAHYVQRMKETSIRDDCTNLYNSRYMHELLEAEISRGQRGNGHFSVVFVDLDHFKIVNDSYGHMVGSQLLREIADIIIHNLRPTDWAIRYGGDEFVFILPGAKKKEAMDLTFRIKNILNKKVFFKNEGHNIRVTASFGIATYPDSTDTKEGIIMLADQAMYAVKESGRNGILHIDQVK